MSLCKFLNPEAVEEAIAEVARVAKAEGVDVALIGGVDYDPQTLLTHAINDMAWD
jgi:hypothetical protein